MEDVIEEIKIFLGVAISVCVFVILLFVLSISSSIDKIANHLDIQKDCIKQNGEYYCKVENEKVGEE